MGSAEGVCAQHTAGIRASSAGQMQQFLERIDIVISMIALDFSGWTSTLRPLRDAGLPRQAQRAPGPA